MRSRRLWKSFTPSDFHHGHGGVLMMNVHSPRRTEGANRKNNEAASNSYSGNEKKKVYIVIQNNVVTDIVERHVKVAC